MADGLAELLPALVGAGCVLAGMIVGALILYRGGRHD